MRIALEGTETAVKLAGSGAKEAAARIYAMLRDERKTKGRTRLVNMLRSGKELRVFAVRDEDLRKFCEQAKRYGVLYTVLKDRSADDGITDVMIRKEDAAKVSRIFERFSLARVDTAAVRAEIEKDRDRPRKDPAVYSLKAYARSRGIPEDQMVIREYTINQYVDEILDKSPEKDPAEGMAAASPRSMPFSGRRSDTKRGESELFMQDRPSVRKQLEEIRKMIRSKTGRKERQLARNTRSKGERA